MITETQRHVTDPESPRQIDRILDFWFGEIIDEMPADPRLKLWFGGGKAVDDKIRENFEAQVIAADQDELASWQQDARGTLALIILLDQFPLNIYRKTARAFAFETSALRVCRAGLDKGYDRQLSLCERSFFYLPLEHSEDRLDQTSSLELHRQLHDEAPPRHAEFTRKVLDYAIQHHATIMQFGRYPYRNEVLDRVSTAAEIDYLAKDGKRYGQ